MFFSHSLLLVLMMMHDVVRLRGWLMGFDTVSYLFRPFFLLHFGSLVSCLPRGLVEVGCCLSLSDWRIEMALVDPSTPPSLRTGIMHQPRSGIESLFHVWF